MGPSPAVAGVLQSVSREARKLFCAFLRNVDAGPMHPKPAGSAAPAEILESCGLDVGEFYGLIKELSTAGLIEVTEEYPQESIRLASNTIEFLALAEDCKARGISLEEILV
jgi:hypothetical protein